jgi:pimeloyl-ACP methyl ester carboxylesterase
MARHHNDPAVTFYGWAGVWLDPEFVTWNLESHLREITAPVLVIQGRGDEYGTLDQVDAVEQNVTGKVTSLVVEGGHSPHLAQPEIVLGTISGFTAGLRRA